MGVDDHEEETEADICEGEEEGVIEGEEEKDEETVVDPETKAKPRPLRYRKATGHTMNMPKMHHVKMPTYVYTDSCANLW